METGVSMDFDIPNDINVEDNEEDEEEQKQREKELQELLTTAFDDMNDDECDGSIGDEHSIILQPQPPQPAHQWPFGMYNETSTPRHEVPPWSVNYTPITDDLPENHYLYTPHPDLNQQCVNNNARSSSVPNGQLMTRNTSPLSYDIDEKGDNQTVVHIPQRDSRQNGHTSSSSDKRLIQDNKNHYNPISHHGKPHAQHNKPNNAFLDHQVCLDEIYQLKVALEKLKEESGQSHRLLNHQLALTQNEKEGLTFSLQQARQLLVDRDRDLGSLNSKVEETEEELKNEKAASEDLRQRFEVSESLVSSLQQQVSELSSYKKLTKVQDSQERLMQCLKEKHQKEMLELKEKLEHKNEELERVEGQLKFLEQYFQQTIPERMEVINRLSQNIESVQNNCQKLLGTDAMLGVEKLRLQQHEREKLEQLNNVKIQNLMETLGELGNKIEQVEKLEMIPLTTHTKLMSKGELEKQELQSKLKNAHSELKDAKERNNKLIVENSKVKNEIEVVMKKHDMLMKSAIEKYHSLHKSEMESCKKELIEKFEEDKSNLCSFYEEKISNIQSEMKQVTHSQDEVKEMYIKVCEERNELEAQLQKLQTVEFDSLQKMELFCNQEVEKKLNKAKILWETDAKETLSEELSKSKKNWEKLYISALVQAATITRETVKQHETLMLKKQKITQEKLDILQTRVATLHRTSQQNEILKWEYREKQLRTQLLHDHNDVISRVKDDLNRQWQGKLMDVQELYKSKLNDIREAQKEELDNIMSEVQKAMLAEKRSLLSKHKEIVLQLKTEMSKLHERLLPTEEKKAVKHVHLRDVAVSCRISMDQKVITEENMASMKRELLDQVKHLQKERETLLMQYHSVLNSLKQSQEQEEQLRKLTRLCRRCKDPISKITDSISKTHLSNTQKRNVLVQTEEKVISREKVLELTTAYANIIRELADEVTRQLSASSQQQAERLRLFIMKYYQASNGTGT